MNLVDKLTALKGLFLDMLLQRTGVHPSLIAELRAKGTACSNPFRKAKIAELKKGEPKEGDDEGDPDEPPEDDDEDIDSKFEGRDGVKIYGIIISEEWAWLFRLFKIECCTAESVRRDLKKRVGDSDTCTLYIDSFGGSVIEAGKIRSALDEWRGKKDGRAITARVEGAAISAAASIMLIGDKITADSQSIIGLHVPIVDCYGSAETHRKTAAFLDSILDAECRLIAKRMKMRPKAIAQKMYEGLDEVWWMAAHEAKKGGLVDSVIGMDDDEPDDDDEPGEDDPAPDDNPAPGEGDDKGKPEMKGKGKPEAKNEPPENSPEGKPKGEEPDETPAPDDDPEGGEKKGKQENDDPANRNKARISAILDN